MSKRARVIALLLFSIGCTLTLIFGSVFLAIKHSREVQKLEQERDMFKKRWEVRDKAAIHWYEEYKELQEKYKLVIDLKEGK